MTARRASRPDRSSASGGPGAVSSARYRDGRWPRSPRGAAESAARARSFGAPRRSDGQPLAPLGSTTSEHAPTRLRSHAGHEAMLALARALLGLICPLRHGCVPLPRSTFAFRALTHEWLAFRQPARPSRCDARFYRWAGGVVKSLPGRLRRCYSGATPGPDRPIVRPIWLRRRTHSPLWQHPQIGSEYLD